MLSFRVKPRIWHPCPQPKSATRNPRLRQAMGECRLASGMARAGYSWSWLALYQHYVWTHEPAAHRGGRHTPIVVDGGEARGPGRGSGFGDIGVGRSAPAWSPCELLFRWRRDAREEEQAPAKLAGPTFVRSLLRCRPLCRSRPMALPRSIGGRRSVRTGLGSPAECCRGDSPCLTVAGRVAAGLGAS